MVDVVVCCVRKLLMFSPCKITVGSWNHVMFSVSGIQSCSNRTFARVCQSKQCSEGISGACSFQVELLPRAEWSAAEVTHGLSDAVQCLLSCVTVKKGTYCPNSAGRGLPANSARMGASSSNPVCLSLIFTKGLCASQVLKSSILSLLFLPSAEMF